MARVYTRKTRKYRNDYNKRNRRYAEKANKKFTWSDTYLIWNRKLQGGKELTDIQIAKVLKRSVQSVQLKRYKMKQKG